ncbi:hypothetical protein STEG23_002215, partial [Scotinomys teguina]
PTYKSNIDFELSLSHFDHSVEIFEFSPMNGNCSWMTSKYEKKSISLSCVLTKKQVFSTKETHFWKLELHDSSGNLTTEASGYNLSTQSQKKKKEEPKVITSASLCHPISNHTARSLKNEDCTWDDIKDRRCGCRKVFAESYYVLGTVNGRRFWSSNYALNLEDIQET